MQDVSFLLKKMTKLKQRQRYSPDVHVTDEGVVEKTYRAKALPLRMVGAVFILWESFIYSKLKGVEGIPLFLASLIYTHCIYHSWGGKISERHQ